MVVRHPRARQPKLPEAQSARPQLGFGDFADVRQRATSQVGQEGLDRADLLAGRNELYLTIGDAL